MGFRQKIGDGVAWLGGALGLPEMNLSEKVSGGGNPNAIQNIYPGMSAQQGLDMVKSGAYAKSQGIATPGVLGASTVNTSAISNTPDTSGISAETRARIAQLQGLYDQLYGQVGTLAQDKRSQVDSQYNTALSDLNKSYETSSTALPAAYAGRGLAKSSYLENAQNTAKTDFENSLTSMNTSRDQNLASIGQWLNSARTGYLSDKSNVGKMDLKGLDYNGLVSLRSQLDSQIASLNTQRAGMGTTANNVASLNSIAPITQTGSQSLASQLQALAQSSAPGLTKDAIANGLINAFAKDTKDKSYWSEQYRTMAKA